MANPKNEASLADLKQRFADTDSLVLTEYRGLTVAQTTELRKALGADDQYSIAKNTLLKYLSAPPLLPLSKAKPLMLLKH